MSKNKLVFDNHKINQLRITINNVDIYLMKFIFMLCPKQEKMRFFL